jgi:hypothetical protein
VDVPLTAARKNAPVLSCCPTDCDYIEGKVRARSPSEAFKLMLEIFTWSLSFAFGFRRSTLCPSGLSDGPSDGGTTKDAQFEIYRRQ